MCSFTCNMTFYMFSLNLWFHTFCTKLKLFTKLHFCMKLMTVSCSMSNFLPIVIIFRQILTSEPYIYMSISLNMFKPVILHVCLLYMSNMFIVYYHAIYIYTSCYLSIIYNSLSGICAHFILF